MSNNALGWIIGGAIGATVGGLVVYAITRPKIVQLEQEIADLKAQRADLSQQVITLQGHIQSIEGYMREQGERIEILESEVNSDESTFDLIIVDLKAVKDQVQDLRITKLIDNLIVRVEQRKAQVLKVRNASVRRTYYTGFN